MPRRLLVVLGFALLFAACAREHAAAPIAQRAPVSTDPGSGPSRDVDPFIGTGAARDVPHPVPNGQSGATFPGAAAPFGMVQWSPDTPGAPAGYDWSSAAITGFSLTHLNGAGCAAARDFPVMPIAGAWDPSAEPRDTFAHDAEIAWPGFYEVTLGSGVRVDLTATARSGLARFTFPEGSAQTVLLLGSHLHEALLARDFEATVLDDGTIVGAREDVFFCATDHAYRVYFAAAFDRPFSRSGIYADGGLIAGERRASGAGAGVFAAFDPSLRSVQMKIGLSYVSVDNARANLNAEIDGWDFDAVSGATRARWDALLGRVALEGGSGAQRRTFETALYHAFLQPAIASDVNGDFVGFDGGVRNDPAHVRYQNFSGWDIYRSWTPLAAVLAPDETSDMMRSLVAAGGECGALPKWPMANEESGVMVGDSADAILASAWAFGASGFDAGAALALMKKGATDPSAACNGKRVRPGLTDDLARGYCPADGGDAPQGPPSTTLEYAIDDFAIAQLARAIGDDATAQALLARARNWRAVFDPNRRDGSARGFVQPRLAADRGGEAAFREVDVASSDAFVEGNAAQYTFMVPHDVAGLVAALGGDASTVARLDAFFTRLNAGTELPYAYMGNEPTFFTPWEYPWAGAPSRTDDVVHRILGELFTPTPDGLPGNDDLGATSAWAAWAMLGMYPLVPGVGGLVLGAPTFARATIRRPGRAPIVIASSGAGVDPHYVQSVTVNGAPRARAWVDWSEIAAGGEIDFVLGDAPNPDWGAAPRDRPPTFLP